MSLGNRAYIDISANGYAFLSQPLVVILTGVPVCFTSGLSFYLSVPCNIPVVFHLLIFSAITWVAEYVSLSWELKSSYIFDRQDDNGRKVMAKTTWK